LGISTSGRSPNVIEAFAAARKQGIQTVALVGGDGGTLRSLADNYILVPSSVSQHIQEVQIVIIHLLCEMVEEWFITVHSTVVNSPPKTNTLQGVERRMDKAIAPDLPLTISS